MIKTIRRGNIIFSTLLFLGLFVNFSGLAQDMQLNILGGAIVTQGSTITIDAGSSLTFRIINVETANCKNLKIKDVDISNISDFDINPNNPKKNIKPQSCNGGKKFLDFEIENISVSCATASTLITIEIRNQADFTFTLEVNSSPEIYVLGGSPWADINHGDTTTSATNGTYFGVVEDGDSVTRRYIVVNIGSCPLDITSTTSSNSDFIVTSPYSIPFTGLDPYYYIVFDVTFTAPATAGTHTSVISIGNTDNTTFTFTVNAEVFDYSIPGPGGVTGDFRLWLKSTRGVTASSSKVSLWEDLGTNAKDASQSTSAKQPTYRDTITDNINFNPVIKFENDGGSLEQYMYNITNGFYSHDIFIVMIPDATMTNSSSKNTIFSGISSGSSGDITGVGFGDYSSEFTNEVLSYNQNIAGGGSYNGAAELNSSYFNAGIINVRNDADAVTKQEILYNSNLLTTSTVNDIAFTNVSDSKYWIGRNFDMQGSLNGRIAEIFTFASRVNDAGRQKIESYLAIKYGITLGSSTIAEKDYINSFGTSVWDISGNSGYNHHVTGIGRDSISDLNQKQSKTLNTTNEVTIGLGGIFVTNSINPNEFKKDGDFLVWGSNNEAYSGTNTNLVTIATGLTTSLTRIDRKWKIVESIEDVNGDVENIFVSIPSAVFSGFSKGVSEEYALIVADNANFTNADIIDVIPLKSDGGTNLQVWYDFDGTKFFTFGKVAQLTGNRSISIGSGDVLIGESSLNLNVDSFTISAWIKSASNASNRTLMSKGTKLQIRLNSADKIEVYVDDDSTPKYTSNMVINDNKWHHTTYIYDSGSLLVYVDGVLDKSVQNVVHPSPNYNHFAIGALCLEKNNIIYPFLGDIDEVYVWDTALTENQLRYLMNQEIERFDISGTDYVDGKTLPQAAASNPVASIPWSSLRVYYDFNSFYGSTIEGLTDNRFFLRLKYLVKDKLVINSQTAPLPYVSSADGVWDNASTWVNGTVINPPNSIGLDGSTQVDWNIVETTHNITSGDKDITVLALKNNSGKITIADPIDSQDETNSGQGLRVTHYLELDGVIDLIGESQLVQDDGSILDEDSGGYLERDQQGTANSYNYNYWSSSVGPINGNVVTRGTGIGSTNTSHSISGFLLDGSTSSTPQNIIFSSAYTAADVGTSNPITLSSYWLYKFNGTHDDYNSWTAINETSSLIPGEGYTMKGASGAVSVTNNQNYVFKGKPYNGDFTLPISAGNDRLIGNPYPSAMDADEFILDNISEAINSNDGRNTVNVFNGALYFWHHFGQENSHYLADYVGGFASYTLMGGTQAYANDSRINATGAAGGKIPERYIPVSQGFFVIAALDAALDSTTTTVSGGDIVFKNSQRVFEYERFTGTNTGSLFFKTNNKSKIKETVNNSDPRAKIRLQFKSPKGYYRQLLLGEDENATINFDIGYDAPIPDLGKDDMFWVFNKSKFVIQAVNNFSVDEEFPLGLKLEEGGIVSIKIDSLQNIDNTIKISIKDNLTEEIHQINNQPFELNLPAGEYLDRFSLKFGSIIANEENVLTIEEEDKIDGIQLFMNNEISVLQIKKENSVEIVEIQLFNYLGQNTGSWKNGFEEMEFSIPLSRITGAYIVQILTTKGILKKKIIIN